MKKRIIIIITAIVGLIAVYFIIQKITVSSYTSNSNETINEETIDNYEDIASNNEISNEIKQAEEIGIDSDTLGLLKINKIGLKGLVKEGSNNEVLSNYIGHIENTSKYNGNIGLAAHNRGNKYSYFARINELAEGDDIIYTTKFGENHYIVEKIREIEEHDWSMLEDSIDEKLTLITCIKDKKEMRLCVQARKE